VRDRLVVPQSFHSAFCILNSAIKWPLAVVAAKVSSYSPLRLSNLSLTPRLQPGAANAPLCFLPGFNPVLLLFILC